jgi:hypothetical protein
MHYTNTDNPIDFPKLENKVYLVTEDYDGEYRVLKAFRNRVDAEAFCKELKNENGREFVFYYVESFYVHESFYQL